MSKLILNMSGGYIKDIATSVHVSVHEKQGARIYTGTKFVGEIVHPDKDTPSFGVYNTDEGAILINSLDDFVPWDSICISSIDLLNAFIEVKENRKMRIEAMEQAIENQCPDSMFQEHYTDILNELKAGETL